MVMRSGLTTDGLTKTASVAGKRKSSRWQKCIQIQGFVHGISCHPCLADGRVEYNTAC